MPYSTDRVCSHPHNARRREGWGRGWGRWRRWSKTVLYVTAGVSRSHTQSNTISSVFVSTSKIRTPAGKAWRTWFFVLNRLHHKILLGKRKQNHQRGRGSAFYTQRTRALHMPLDEHTAQSKPKTYRQCSTETTKSPQGRQK